MRRALERLLIFGVAASVVLLPGAAWAARPEPGLAVDYERAVAFLERVTGEAPCAVSERLDLTFYVPTYQPLAGGGRPSPPLPFVDAIYKRYDACTQELLETASGPIEVDAYAVDPLKSASIVVHGMGMYDTDGALRETFAVDLTWTAVGLRTPISLDPGNDGGVEAGLVVGAELTGSLNGINTTLNGDDAIFAEIGSIHRITIPAPQ
jgi:hypothetical protein